MANVAFDTLEFVETLEQAGVPKDQARAFSSAVQKSHEAANLATKDDLEKVEASFRHEISDLRKDMDAKFASVDAKFASAEAKQEALRKDLDAKLEQSASTLRQEMLSMKFDLLKWIVGIAFLQTGIGLAAKFFGA